MKPKLSHILSLAALMAIATACKKDPTPTPNPNQNPTDTITPHTEPTYPDTVYVPFEWNYANQNIDPAKNPNMDTIRFYASKPQVKKIIMVLLPPPDDDGIGYNYSSGWVWRPFKRARDTLYQRYYICPEKVCAKGKLTASQYVSDSMSYGCRRSDSTDLANLGLTMTYCH